MSRFLTIFIIIFSVHSVNCQENDYALLFLKKDYNKIIELASKNSNSANGADDFYWYAYALNKAERDNEAIEILQKGQTVFPDSSNITKLLIDVLFENGRYREVLQLINTRGIIAEDFDLVKKKIIISEFYEEYPKAIQVITSSLKSDSLNQYLRMHLADNYFRTGNDTSAIANYTIVLDQNPGNMIAARKLGKIYLKKEPNKAIAICDTILKSDSLNITFNRIKALSLAKQEEYNKALKIFERIHALGDTSVSVIKNIGVLKFKTDNFHEALPYIKKSLKNDSLNVELTYIYGLCLANSNKKEDALAYFNKSVKLLTPDPKMLSTINEQIAFTYRELKNYQLSIQHYQKAYSIDTTNVALLRSIASIYDVELKNKKNALKYYETFLRKLPETRQDTLTPSSLFTIRLRKFAEQRIKSLKEDLFFENELTP